MVEAFRTPLDRRAPLPLGGRDVPQGARRRAGRQPSNGGGGWPDRRRGAADARRPCGGLGERRLLDGVPARSGASRPSTRASDGFRRARRAEAGGPQGTGGASCQRCRVHFMRNLRAVVRTVFAQPDHASAMAQPENIVAGLRLRFGRAATLLADAAKERLSGWRGISIIDEAPAHWRGARATGGGTACQNSARTAPQVEAYLPMACVMHLSG